MIQYLIPNNLEFKKCNEPNTLPSYLPRPLHKHRNILTDRM